MTDMVTRTLPDGAVVDVKSCGRCAGPNGEGGQQFGTSWPYYRVNGGLWNEKPLGRSMHKIVEVLELAENVAEFEAYVRDWA